MNQKLIKSLLEAAAYPEPTSNVRLIETHVSFIFITDHFVYKVKKAVDFGFLDFTTIDRRRFYCEEEVRLNRRLCADIYLGVVELRESDGTASFAGPGRIIDYAVKMKRLPEARMLDRLLESGEAGPEEMLRIARVLAQFHGAADRGPQIDACGSLSVIRGNWEENFRQAEPFVGVTITRRELADLRRFVEAFLLEKEELFRQRVAAGFIRECDGDLHAGNICLTDEICIFDCIEFNERFRYIDTAADLAFLLMDLEYAGHPELSDLLLDAYQGATGDTGMTSLLGFYQAQRAFVRGKVKSFLARDAGIPSERAQEAGKTAARYFRLARGYALRARLSPTVIITCGLIGSGKSFLAQQLSFELGLELRRSDLVRKRLAGLPPTGAAPEAFRAGIYNRDMDEKTYALLLQETAEALSRGKSIIIDATFRRAEDRERFRSQAAELGAGFAVLETSCPEEVIRRRLEARSLDPNQVSDARWEHFRQQLSEYQAPAPGESIVIDSTLPVCSEADLVYQAMGLLP